MHTIYDIAKLSGVSKSTVSRVLTNHPYVSEEKKAKVNDAIKTLNYKPNVLARQFRKKRTYCIGIAVPDINHPYFSQLVGVLSTKCYEKGYKAVIYQTFWKPEVEIEVFNKLHNKEMDGLILTSTSLSEEEISNYIENVIIVACNENYSGNFFSVFCLDEEEAIYEATKYLLENGLTQLGFCSDNIQTPSQRARLKGYIKAHKHKNITYSRALIFDRIITIEDGIQLGNEILKEKNRLQGIIAGSDFVAAGILKAASLMNVSVPNELSVIGFDNHPITLVSNPSLTTVCNTIEIMSEELIAHLVICIEQEGKTNIKRVYTGELIFREST